MIITIRVERDEDTYVCRKWDVRNEQWVDRFLTNSNFRESLWEIMELELMDGRRQGKCGPYWFCVVKNEIDENEDNAFNRIKK